MKENKQINTKVLKCINVKTGLKSGDCLRDCRQKYGNNREICSKLCYNFNDNISSGKKLPSIFGFRVPNPTYRL
ncbi:MAG: hypothetical protein HQK79_19690 [Desulfobacterales bacterium]|nr:hypothetical protein [Desulfobacterales bacterium]MBF0398311.1 hypothetical protein [Desulfobacterales bacterium]